LALSRELARQPTLDELYGICADDPIVIDEEGITEGLDEQLIGTFD
jgi:hypothetical protein